MNITVIGATGMVGSRLVTEAATRGHGADAAVDEMENPVGERHFTVACA